MPPPAGWYEKAAPLRAKEERPLPSDDWRFGLFLSEDLKPGKILDVGCGDGGFLGLAKNAGWTGVGVDYDERVIARAAERGVEAHSDDLVAFLKKRRPADFDAAVLFDVLEHTPEPAELLDAVTPLLKKGGHLALTLPNAARPLPFKREEHDYPPHHFTRWTPEAMRGFLERRGYEVVRQDAGTLKLAYLSDHLYFAMLAPLIAIYKRIKFGPAASGKTVTELEAGGTGALSDKAKRQGLVDAVKLVLRVLTWPVAALMWAFYKLTRPLPGDSLYTLARRAS